MAFPAITIDPGTIYCSVIEALRIGWKNTSELNTLIPSTDNQDDNRVYDLSLGFTKPDSPYATFEDLGQTNVRNSSGSATNLAPTSGQRIIRIVARLRCREDAIACKIAIRDRYHRGLSALTEEGTLNSLTVTDDQAVFISPWHQVISRFNALILT